VGKRALIKYQRYAHAKQFKRAGKQLRRIQLGRVSLDIEHKIAGRARGRRRAAGRAVPC
jgi:transposase, IS5 family